MADEDDYDACLLIMVARYEWAATAMHRVAVTLELMADCPQAVTRTDLGSTITYARKAKDCFDAEIASVRALIAKRHARRMTADNDDAPRVM